ncbi:allophanate hydrolase [Acinetobacter rudis]|uniref:allophanate hydrolase n=1 Tax=Acinetobacter rudis TaxID=632955 RepID=UPI0028107992|nr:allophanate hydrolase [Acinetobacter rudis]MDQ8953920.1 allophanate hydrolase [Acinetobacter rudis]
MFLEKIYAWTIQDWQQAYENNDIAIEQLIDLVKEIDLEDTAWISIASVAQIQQQIDLLHANLKQSQHIQQQYPLYGIPFAVKDNIDVKGFISTAAYKCLSEPAKQDATLVQRLKQAGAIVIGKTNLDQFATGLVGTRSPYGAVRNSFNSAFISGGSSAGSASVVARGIVPFSLGTDTAGSGRVPAGFNNIVGLKPTRGRFSNYGLIPACKSLDCISIFALTVTDAEYIANIAEKYDGKDSYSRKNPHTAPARFSSQLKFAVPSVLNFFNDQQSEDAFNQAIKQLQELSVTITEIDFKPFEMLASQLYQSAWVAERTAATETYLKQDLQAWNPTVLEIIQQGYQYSAIDAYNAEYLKQNLSREIQQILVNFDALLVPTAPTIHRIEEIEANPIQLNAQLGIYTNFTNLADLSALALPAGFRTDGLPFGITLIAPAWHDGALAHFGQLWQNFIDLPLGATHKKIPLSPVQSYPSKHHIRVAVVGAHLTGMPLNFQLCTRQAVLIETTKTAAKYSLYALNGTQPAKPGLARDEIHGQAIIVELWDIPTARFGEFVAEIPPPLGMGNIELQDGRWVKGFICEPYGLENAENISQFGGWRAYIQQSNTPTLATNTGE